MYVTCGCYQNYIISEKRVSNAPLYYALNVCGELRDIHLIVCGSYFVCAIISVKAMNMSKRH